MERLLKSLFTVLLLLFSIVIIGIHQYGLFPAVLVFALISLGLVLVAAVLFRTPVMASITFIIGVAVIYRLIVFLYPATLIGVDTDKKAYWTSEVLRVGSTDGIRSDFYQQAPLYHIHSASIAEIANISVIDSFVIYPLLSGIIVPLTSAILVRLIIPGNSDVPSVIAATIAAVSTAVMQQSYWPIAQTFSLFVWCIFIISLALYLKRRPQKQLLILTLCVVSLVYSHKLPLVLVLGLLAATGIALYLVRSESSSTGVSIQERPELSMFVLCGLILFLHWGYVSYYMDDVIRRITVLFASGSASAPSAPSIPTAVDPVNPGLIGQTIAYPNSLSLFFERSHAVVLLLVAGGCWAYIAYELYTGRRLEKETTSLVLGGAAFGVILTALGVISIGALNPNRPLMMIEPLLAVIIAITVYSFLWGRQNIGHYLGVFVVVLLLITQLFAAPAIPDYPNTPRYYLTADEVEGKSFGCEYMNETIHTDYYSYQERFINGEHCDAYYPMDRGYSDSPLFNGTVTEKDFNTIAYRPSVDVYLGTHSRWKLNWDIESELDAEYSRTYNNGGFYLYHNQTHI
ncbi:hypothetical protein [Natronosalvus vescus]|uniref:hypothetical protein n=1 Tax=Natronosalvus vescus TaxID=2953881 RepID=UPI002090B43D|nr:hypothetical protein [Natronosalvus vescus]